jgi:hypothetical protein
MASITLPPELEIAIRDQARHQGTTVELLALDKLSSIFLTPRDNSITTTNETMADYLRDFIGCIDSREIVPDGADMSEYSGRKFGELLRKKHEAGKL